MRWVWLFFLTLWPSLATADIVVATRTIRAQSVIMPGDLRIEAGEMAGTVERPELIIGQETRVALYEGRPVRLADVGPPAVIERNQIVPLVFEQGGLRITSEGRALMRAGPGDVVRVMNLSSRLTVSGLAQPTGMVLVSN